MFGSAVELFLSQYFFICAVIGRFLENGRELFLALSKIFFIPRKDAHRLYNLTQKPAVKRIDTQRDYLLHLRIRKYARLAGTAQSFDAEEEEALSIKGNAIAQAENKKLAPSSAPKNIVYGGIESAVSGGEVSALRIKGILQYEGIFFGMNKNKAVTMLSKASEWNDTVSTLALLYYRKQNRKLNITRLFYEVADTPYEKLYEIAVKKYGVQADGKAENIKLLSRAFASSALDKDIYSERYARIINSTALCQKDKQIAVFARNGQLAEDLSGLPLKLSGTRTAPLVLRKFRNMTLTNKAETDKVLRILAKTSDRSQPSYRPVCLCCNSKRVLDGYAEAMTVNSDKINTRIINAADLREYDLLPDLNNIFIRSIDEDKDNPFLIFFCGVIPQNILNAVKAFLSFTGRAEFRLNSPRATLDLSAVLPVCLCDLQNEHTLSPYCEVIRLSEAEPPLRKIGFGG